MTSGKVHEPNDKIRQTVRDLKAFGITQDQISKYLKIGRDTLTRHYEHELETGKIHAIYKVAGALYHSAVVKGNVSAQIFFLKTQGGWRTADGLDNSIQNAEILEKINQVSKALEEKYKRDY
jgi:hypothetical protein